VAATFLDLVLEDTKSVHLRNRYASLVLDAFSASRMDKRRDVIKALTRQVSLRENSLIKHSIWWLVGRQVGTSQFVQLLEDAKKL